MSDPTPSPHGNETPPCPRCGGDTALRNGRLGKFYGCRQYPACRGSVDFNTEEARRIGVPPQGHRENGEDIEDYYDAFLYDAGDR